MPSFRAIVVGAGPTGLAIGHALALADVDYVILEKQQEVAEPGSGASLALWPQSLRILDQFNLLEEAMKQAMPMRYKRNYRPDGSEISRSNMFERVEKNHGYPWILFHRSRLLAMLYEKLPDVEARVQTGKEVTSMECGPKGVWVRCADGTVHEGSIVIACDGVHSRIRSSLRDSPASASFSAAARQFVRKHSDTSEKPMKASYQCLFGCLPRPRGLVPETVYEARGSGRSFHVLVGSDQAYFLVYKKLPKATADRANYTDKDAEKLAEEVANCPIAEDILFKDLWEGHSWSRLTNLAEGFLKKWHHDRVVLVGDAVHKMTPNAGLSLNTAWQGAIDLINRLRSLLEVDADPDTQALTKVFKSYQRSRQGLARRTAMCSSMYTRVVAWQNVVLRAADWLTPHLGGDMLLLKALGTPIVKRGITLDFVEEGGHRTGKVPWVNKPRLLNCDSRTSLCKSPVTTLYDE